MSHGEVWLVALDPTVGSEIRKTRPCVIISPPELHDHLRTVMVVPMTTGSRPAPFRTPVTCQGKTGLMLLDQIRTVDKGSLVKKAGAVADEALLVALTALREIFAE
ncbi:type II toxin-antitoxin system PemK/MazF family toxin [Cupriavidus sp. WKF15]|uniref:type II toxin-antitoxin system PemK/MazF family toxin n=1 Tax=Cupriavidus sp. WKF15 TaxID=3032282 RepID=UPI0023E1769A|nr:type II toxin-antitoxin system PemK/MazF family toxin [Cupriavidus sp. WKF15]WER47267.1 type II toxin-antitoxin system PemK/MazF family toxin [Cupriavidus sp. WKF15]